MWNKKYCTTLFKVKKFVPISGITISDRSENIFIGKPTFDYTKDQIFRKELLLQA